MENNVLVKVFAGEDEEAGLLYSGMAKYQEKDRVRILRYTDQENVENRVRFSDSGCIVSRKGEDEIKLRLAYSGESYIEVKSDYGTMKFDVDPDYIIVKDNEMKIRYSIPENSEEEVVFDFSWKITGRLS